MDEGLANKIESSSDPTSEDYMGISASWELGFSDYNLVVLEGEEKNIENGLLSMIFFIFVQFLIFF